jgi:hypothetical protein
VNDDGLNCLFSLPGLVYNSSPVYFFFIASLGDNVDCWMEIQEGKGPWAKPVSGIVPLGNTMTMVIGINDNSGQYYFNFNLRKYHCTCLIHLMV